MKRTGKIAVVLLCAALTLIMPGCKNESGGEDQNSSAQTKSSTVRESGDIKLKTYSFPEFLSDMGDADMFSNAVYKSFDPASIMAEPEKQPFEGYKCTACFNENYYIFKDEDNYGLMNYEGTVLIGSDGINKISAVSADLLRLKYDDGSSVYFQTDGISGTMVTVEDFDQSRIGFAARQNADSDEYSYVLQLDGTDIYETPWTSAEETDADTLDTLQECEALYKVTSGGEVYYIAFDRFYNFTVYEAAYAFISLKIGGEYGECYVEDFDDYSELQTLISSFGRAEGASAPSKDENSDYIQITLGVESGSRSTLTISSDGYCLTDNTSEDGKPGNKFFTVMDPETFVDLINWVDSTLGEEYGK